MRRELALPLSGQARCGGTNQNNEIWDIGNTSGGETSIWAYYYSNYMCMNVAGGNYSSGTQIYAWNCDPSNGGVQSNEEFYLQQVTTEGGYPVYEIHPWNPPGLCLNVAGGFGNGNNIILYGCSTSYLNEDFELFSDDE